MTQPTARSIVVCGLPGSGKTTFLAALWHVVQTMEINPHLKLASFDFAEYDYVNTIRTTWLYGKRQSRTVGAARTIGIDLLNPNRDKIQLLFPDHSGETFDGIWGNRICEESVADQLRDRSGTLMFLRSQKMKQPIPLIDAMIVEADMQAALPGNQEPAQPAVDGVPWNAADTPDQVKLIDLLQTLQRTLKGPEKEKIAICISAWDTVDNSQTPATFIEKEMPLLHQYLKYADHGLDIRLYGVSAQGGEYLREKDDGAPSEHLNELLGREQASSRITLVGESEPTSDLTLPIAWLMS